MWNVITKGSATVLKTGGGKIEGFPPFKPVVLKPLLASNLSIFNKLKYT